MFPFGLGTSESDADERYLLNIEYHKVKQYIELNDILM